MLFLSDFLWSISSWWIPVLVLVVPWVPKPLAERYTKSFVDIKRLSNIILYVPGGACGRVFKKAKITVAILFLSRGLGILLIFCGPSPFVCQNQCTK